MKNIFAKFQEYVNKPKRNVFDMSFRNNLTLKFGELTPVFCKEVVPGDSFKIHTAFGLQLMPMKFPVQTPMKAYIHYFYVRNRTIWKDWMDFIGGTKENLVSPYVTPLDKKKFFRVGGLADYLGVPNVFYGKYGSEVSIQFTSGAGSPTSMSNDDYTYEYMTAAGNLDPEYFPLAGINTSDVSVVIPDREDIGNIPLQTNLNSIYLSGSPTITDEDGANIIPCQVLCKFDSNYKDDLDVCFWNLNPSARNQSENFIVLVFNKANNQYVGKYFVDDVVPELKPALNANENTYDKPFYRVNLHKEWYDFISSGEYTVIVAHYLTQLLRNNQTGAYGSAFQVVNTAFPTCKPYYILSAASGTGAYNIADFGDSPYDSDIHLSALPFRAYEAIYNSYYRNPQNNPFILNGVPEYNRYVTNLNGGADSTQYDLFFRNWEYDFLTSAVQSPQQGVAPLVGMSMTGEATFADEEGNTYYAQAILNDNGEITGWQSHSSNMPVGSLRLLMDMAGTGISINDLRNVNAFQRFLENNIRHGLKYKDQVMSHFGVKVRYDELDMPEFIGGVSTMVDVNKLSQTSNSGDTPLGSFVGQASALAESNHDITHYCDEHGFIIGIMSVVPIPVYSQLLPKFFIKNTQLDYYFPEFGHIGYQPIQQKEVSPLQTFYAGEDLNAVFGYNRAWYDYLASTDEVHGQFRTTMRDFIMNRTFDSSPELSEEFLLVDPDQLNDVFLAGTDDDLYAPEADKIIGSILFNVIAKRPIPLFGIPKLEG